MGIHSKDNAVNETRTQRTLRELAEIGAKVSKDGAVYDIRFRDEHIKTTDLGTVTHADILLLSGKRQPEISRQGARRLSGRDWETVSFQGLR